MNTASTLKTTIRLKKSEAIDLQEKAFHLTKKNIMSGRQKIYSEADLVHYAIEQMLTMIALDEHGHLILKKDS
ncbi:MULTISPECIES: hypothetical protein [Xenorhabdus]|uniref:Mobilization protein BmgB n=1 Tax=Xenorhabdus griffiniae TaxID=351672 RepID=A0ABY9XN26_9GAMM|nr:MULTISPECIES: hypothetical protein [Xenorhabdus]MBD1226401.1 hypothetical protein [Xenorhabdus griffiniae]MBE8588720.1 hypothetical protein [Xenorhabdus griffiniae]MDC9615775.1 hypothetical protein [Xenorhabdus khoisanae]WMV74343.1 hypothetical protein QL128_10290 [Xenorhabdus griffiniae]WNH04023.1 hypothetical protein QL112_010295 [Xenorhabdus griffiniae]